MVDDFMVCVDRIIASACFDSVVVDERESNNNSRVLNLRRGEEVMLTENECNNHDDDGNNKNSSSNNKSDGGCEDEGCCSKKIRECRICQEEDEEEDMEAPCACNGTLKFAHRKCIQRWCNKKGDITCEICNQVYSPNYTLPPARTNPDVMAIDIRQAWGPHIDLRDPHFLAFAAAERQFLQSEYEEYAAANSGTVACFRSVVIILMLILLLRQALMVTRDFGMVQEASSFLNLQISILQLAGFLLPCYAMARSWYLMQSRRRRQVGPSLSLIFKL
ncbi:hypothetical protein LguiB_027086 [Lonicera macranthoides]